MCSFIQSINQSVHSFNQSINYLSHLAKWPRPVFYPIHQESIPSCNSAYMLLNNQSSPTTTLPRSNVPPGNLKTSQCCGFLTGSRRAFQKSSISLPRSIVKRISMQSGSALHRSYCISCRRRIQSIHLKISPIFFLVFSLTKISSNQYLSIQIFSFLLHWI